MFRRSFYLQFFLVLALLLYGERKSLNAHLSYNRLLTHECYRLIDLGETDVHEHMLSRGNFPASLGPRINQKGYIVGNAKQGGFVYDQCNPEIYLRRNGEAVTVYDINDKNLILASVRYDRRNVEWLLWPFHCFCRDEMLIPLDLKCIAPKDVYFRSLNNHGLLVGSRECRREKGYKAVFYQGEKGLQDLTSAFLMEVNDSGNMVGHESMVPEKTPLLFHYKGGWNGFSDTLPFNKPGCIIFETDIAIAPDNTVFGSFRGFKNGGPYIFAYSWAPCENDFHVHDLCGMQISAVNGCHVLVGTLGGEAVISINMQSPVTLASLIAGGWPQGVSLIEATDINDLGQIVGFGRWNGMIHLFLLDPIR